MEQKHTIYSELKELISTVNDVDFLYEIKHQIEEHEQIKVEDWADELSKEQKADLEADLAETDTEKNCVSWEEYQKFTARWNGK